MASKREVAFTKWVSGQWVRLASQSWLESEAAVRIRVDHTGKELVITPSTHTPHLSRHAYELVELSYRQRSQSFRLAASTGIEP